MKENQEFFSPNHKRLLSIATLSRSLTWVVLVVFALVAVGQLLQYQNYASSYFQMNVWEYLIDQPVRAFNLLVNMADTVLKGIIYFLVLKGISLGLNMIVETDINYREQREAK